MRRYRPTESVQGPEGTACLPSRRWGVREAHGGGASEAVAAAAAAVLVVAGLLSIAIGERPAGESPGEPAPKAATTAPAKAQSPPAVGTAAAEPKAAAEPGKPTADPKRTSPPAADAADAKNAHGPRFGKLKSNQASKRNNGSAKVLSGRICLIHLFLRDRDSAWPPQERQAEQQRVSSALDFLYEQGRRYDKEFAFIEDTLPEVDAKQIIPLDMFHSPWWIEEVIRQAGYKDGPDLVRAMTQKHKAQQAVIMLHVNKRATSFNLTYYKGINSIFEAERVVMYARYADGRPTCAASYAHEVLHSFGAGELYFPFDADPARKTVAQKLFPNDVMLRVAYETRTLDIGAYTAYRIGWLSRLDDKYKVFED